jgi:hypothetical protein
MGLKVLLFGLIPPLLYLAWVNHGQGETLFACLMLGAAGICYGLIKQESPRP